MLGRNLWVSALGVAIVIVFGGAASAQGVTSSLTLAGPSKPLESNRETAIVQLNITYMFQGAACTSAVSVPVTLAASLASHAMHNDSMGNMSMGPTVRLSPSQVTFTIPAGGYVNSQVPAASPFRSTQSVVASIDSPNASNLTTVAVHVTAAAAAGSGGPCQPGLPPAATASSDFSVTFNVTSTTQPTSPEIPFPAAAVPLALLAIVAMLRRRNENR